MKFTFHAFFLLLLSVLQVTVADAIAVFGIKPNLFLVYAVVYALMCEKKEAATVGAVFGLALDILAGRFLGVHAVLMLITGFFTAYLCETVLSRENILIALVITLLFSIVYESIYYVFTFSILKNIKIGNVFATVTFGESVYNTLVSVLLYPPIKRFISYVNKKNTL